jgi:hypothetical protein
MGRADSAGADPRSDRQAVTRRPANLSTSPRLHSTLFRLGMSLICLGIVAAMYYLLKRGPCWVKSAKSKAIVALGHT